MENNNIKNPSFPVTNELITGIPSLGLEGPHLKILFCLLKNRKKGEKEGSFLASAILKEINLASSGSSYELLSTFKDVVSMSAGTFFIPVSRFSDDVREKRHYPNNPNAVVPIIDTLIPTVLPDGENKNLFYYYWSAREETLAMLDSVLEQNASAFTKLLEDALKMKGKYSFRLYAKLKMEYGIQSSKSPDDEKKQYIWYLFKDSSKAPSFLKFFKLENKRSFSWAIIKRNILDKSLKEINNISDEFSVEYEPLFTPGKSSQCYVYAIRFVFTQKMKRIKRKPFSECTDEEKNIIYEVQEKILSDTSTDENKHYGFSEEQIEQALNKAMDLVMYD